jgi:hypothetical protein
MGGKLTRALPFGNRGNALPESLVTPPWTSPGQSGEQHAGEMAAGINGNPLSSFL